MNIVLVDASSAILLHKAELFEAMCDIYPLAMVPAVVMEITVGDQPGAADFRRLLAVKRVTQVVVALEPAYPRVNFDALGKGERDTILAFGLGRARFILIDDAKGARTCRKLNIPYINALLCPELLYVAGRLQRRERGDAFERLLSLGRYAQEIVAYARRCRGSALARFYPPCEPP